MNNCSVWLYLDGTEKVKAERITGEVRLCLADSIVRVKDKQALDLCMQLTEVIKQIDQENKLAVNKG